MKNKIKIILGDPHDDGHGKIEHFAVVSNHTKEELCSAYEQSVLTFGLTFNSRGTIGESISRGHPEYKDREVCVEYASYEPSELAKHILESAGLEVDEDFGCYELLELFLNFIKLSLPGLEYEIVNEYKDRLNLIIGYGMFD